jgi:hypothetical protein
MRKFKPPQILSCPTCKPFTNHLAPLNIHRLEPLRLPLSPMSDLLETPSCSDAASNTTTSGSISSTTAGTSLPTLSGNVDSHSAINSNDTLPKALSDDSGNVKDTWNVRALTIRRALKPSREKLPREELCRPSSFCFSASGRSLLTWGGNARGFMRFALSPDQEGIIEGSAKWEVDCIKTVACGDERIIVIASHQEVISATRDAYGLF